MSLVLVVAAAGLIALPGLTGGRPGSLLPSEKARLDVISLLTGMTSLGLALALCAAPVVFGVLKIPPIGLVGAEHFFPGGPPAGWVSLIALSALIAIGLMALIRHLLLRQRLADEASFAIRTTVDGASVVVLPTQALMAVALPGQGGSVVVTQGTVDRLDGPELAAVVRHEVSHLTHRHHWYLLVADLVDRVFGRIPAASRSTGSLRLAIEQWADDESVRRHDDRVALSAAMRRLTGLAANPTLAAFAQADLLARRLEYVETVGQPASVWTKVFLYASTAGALAGAVVSFFMWLSHVQHLH